MTGTAGQAQQQSPAAAEVEHRSAALQMLPVEPFRERGCFPVGLPVIEVFIKPVQEHPAAVRIREPALRTEAAVPDHGSQIVAPDRLHGKGK